MSWGSRAVYFLCDKTETISDAKATANISASNIVRGITPFRAKPVHDWLQLAKESAPTTQRTLYYCLPIMPTC